MDLRTSFNSQLGIAEGSAAWVNEALLEVGTGTKLWLFILFYIQNSFQRGFIPGQPVLPQMISLNIWGLGVGQRLFLSGSLNTFMLFWRLRKFNITHTPVWASYPEDRRKSPGTTHFTNKHLKLLSSKSWSWFFKFKDVEYLDSSHLSCLETLCKPYIGKEL